MRVSLDFGVLAFQRQTGFEPAQYTVFMRVSEGYYQQIINFFKKQQKKGTGKPMPKEERIQENDSKQYKMEI